MMKRIVGAFLAIMLFVSMTAACGNKSESGNNNSTTAAQSTAVESTTAKETMEPVEITAVWGSQAKGWDLQTDNLLEKVMKEKFNITVKWLAQIPGQDTAAAAQKLMLMFTSGDYPDWVVNVNAKNEIDTLGKQGLIQEADALLPKVPNYRKLFTDEDWEYTVIQQRADNGKLYFLPQFRPHTSIYTWLYRKDIFDKHNLKFPTTDDEMFDTLMTLKKAYPDSVPIANRWGWWQASQGIYPMFNIMDNQYVDPYTEEFIPFGQATNQYREAVRFMSKLYKNELLDKEFMTAKDSDWENKFKEGKAFMQFASAGWSTKIEAFNKTSDPNAVWEYSNDLVFDDPGKKLYYKDVPGMRWGITVSDKLTDKRLDRFLEFADWLATDEGLIFQGFGIEGVTYEMVDGAPQYLNSAVNAFGSNPDKPMPESFGLTSISAWSREYSCGFYGNDNNLKFGDQIIKKPEYKAIKGYPVVYDASVTGKVAELRTILTDKANEYSQKFVLGVMDPTDDKQWNQYIQELEKAGLKEFSELVTAAYKQTYKK